GAGKLWSEIADRVLSIICCLLAPASTHSVRFRNCASSVRAAAALKQFGPRSLGFQNSGASKPAAQERSTRQAKPCLPLTTVSERRPPRRRTLASAEIDGGAALRASAISSARLLSRYCSIGAIVG